MNKPPGGGGLNRENTVIHVENSKERHVSTWNQYFYFIYKVYKNITFQIHISCFTYELLMITYGVNRNTEKFRAISFPIW